MDNGSPANAKKRPSRITNRIDSTVRTPKPLDEVFPFFADAANLTLLTPEWLRFEIMTPRPIEMKLGAVIDYRIRMRGIPMRWRTVITEWDPPHRFVDEQARGPYRYWRHEHTFERTPDGSLLGDRVEYAVVGGWLIDRLIVRRDLDKIFGYRAKKMRELFEAESVG